jgi:hypothetical protein
MLNAGLRRLVWMIWDSEEKGLAALKLNLSELVDNGFPLPLLMMNQIDFD